MSSDGRIPATGSFAVPVYRVAPWVTVWGAVFMASWAGNQFSPLLIMYQERSHYSSVLVNVFLGVYVLGLAPALLLAGTLSDRLGRRPVMLIGILASLLGSALLALGADSVVFLTAGRLLSGMTVGVAMAAGNTWLKELSQQPFDREADAGAGARRAALAFTLGSASGALVAGCLAQWAPEPGILPYMVHIAMAAPFAALICHVPETGSQRPPRGSWWKQLRIPAARHPRFIRVVLPVAPWIFAAAALGYGWMPTQLTGATGSLGLVFATAATVVALGASSAVQPLALRLHSTSSARALVVALSVITLGLAGVLTAVHLQSVVIGLAANALTGAGIGLALVSSLLEIQRLADSTNLAGLAGMFYATAYAGFTVPALMSSVAGSVGAPATAILALIVILAVSTVLALLVTSHRYLAAFPSDS